MDGQKHIEIMERKQQRKQEEDTEKSISRGGKTGPNVFGLLPLYQHILPFSQFFDLILMRIV